LDISLLIGSSSAHRVLALEKEVMKIGSDIPNCHKNSPHVLIIYKDKDIYKFSFVNNNNITFKDMLNNFKM